MPGQLVYLVENDYRIQRMFEKKGWRITDNSEIADLIQFTGGSDVTPYYYGQEAHPTVQNNEERDEREAKFYTGLSNTTPKAGICRGGQFLHVMNGGSLFQDVNNHAIFNTHPVYLMDGSKVQVTSTHHQIMKGLGMLPIDIIGVAYESTRREWVEEGEIIVENKKDFDYEILFYGGTNSLCFQPHPEYGVKECEDLYFGLLFQCFALM